MSINSTNVVNYYEFFHSNLPYTSSWIVIDDTFVEKYYIKSTNSLLDILYKYLREEYWVYDSDTCGTNCIKFVIRNIKTKDEIFINFDHSWWWDYVIDDHERVYSLENEFYHEIQQESTFEYPALNRDYLKLSKK